MDLRKLQAAAEHERDVATAASTAVPLVAAKVERAKADVVSAEQSLLEAQHEADDTAVRAEAAEAAYRDAADGADVAANAGVAAATGKAI